MTKICRVFEDNGCPISEVTPLTKKIEVETVFNQQKEANYLRMYLDADNPNPRGSHRPCLRVGFAPDGRTVETITLYGAGGNVEFDFDVKG